jgi:hypothetical protein
MITFDPQTVLIKWNGADGFRTVDAFSGVCVLGATGSGKSSGPARLIARAYLKNGFGGLVLCAKPEERLQWQRWAKQEGRERDLVIVNAAGAERFNFLEWAANLGGEGAGFTINIVSLFEEIGSAVEIGGGEGEHGGGDSVFFRNALSHFLMNVVDLPLLAGLRVELPLMRAIAASAPLSIAERDDSHWREQSVCWQALREADVATKDNPSRRADYEECRSYWEQDFPTLSDRTRSIITLMFSILMRPFVTHPLRRLFAEDTTVRPEDTFDGKIIIIDLPVQEYRLAGRAAALAWKWCFQLAVMRRSAGHEVDMRPAFLWSDEAQWFATERDAEYQAVARSARGCTVYITQQRESIRRALRNNDAVENLLANLQTKVFCQNTGETNRWASELLGDRFLKITSINVNNTSQQTADGAAGGVNSSSGIQRNEQRRPWLEDSRFTTLRRGGPTNDNCVEAIVYCGGKLFHGPEGSEPLPYKLLTFRQN